VFLFAGPRHHPRITTQGTAATAPRRYLFVALLAVGVTIVSIIVGVLAVTLAIIAVAVVVITITVSAWLC
jgi:hypothetical protein